MAERGRVARLLLRYREAAGFYAKAAEATAFDLNLAWGYTLDAAGALRAQGDEFGNNAALAEAIQTYRLRWLSPRSSAFHLIGRGPRTLSALRSHFSVSGKAGPGVLRRRSRLIARRSRKEDAIRFRSIGRRRRAIWVMRFGCSGNE